MRYLVSDVESRISQRAEADSPSEAAQRLLADELAERVGHGDTMVLPRLGYEREYHVFWGGALVQVVTLVEEEARQ